MSGSRYIKPSSAQEAKWEKKALEAQRQDAPRQLVLKVPYGTELELKNGDKVTKLHNYMGKVKCRRFNGTTHYYKPQKFKIFHVHKQLLGL